MSQQQSPEKLLNRNPRYVLQMKDKKILRYAPFPRGNRAFFTDIVNLSESGMAFTVPYLDSPHIGEVIMVEFTPPGIEPIACYALVKRVQKYNLIESDFFQKNCKLVAVQFTNMQESQTKALKLALDKEFKVIQNHFRKQQFWLKVQWHLKFNKKLIFLLGASAVALLSPMLFFFFI